MVQPDVKEQVRKYISRKLQPQPVKIRSDVEMTCYEYDGVERLKGAMRAAMGASTADVQVRGCVWACTRVVVPLHQQETSRRIWTCLAVFAVRLALT